MAFTLPVYSPPDFTAGSLSHAPAASTLAAPANGVAPDKFHATSNHPEYIHIGNGRWLLAEESRMDCVLVLKNDSLETVEGRRLKKGDKVIVGRTENGEEGILVYTEGFQQKLSNQEDKFAFRTRGTRETPFSRSYDQLYELLRYDHQHGHILWVLGPAIAFDKDSRHAMQELISEGYCHALLAGNALATHDLEAAHYHTGLGQDIYTQELKPLGHYNHLDILNTVREKGSLASTIKDLGINDGIIYACEQHKIPFVLAGSIRDDGPLPEIIADVYQAQDEMRHHAKSATTVICLATQLHSIAVGNMTPSYQVLQNGDVRPVYFYIVDMTEFSADKLANRGSGQAVAILTNAQDFIINLWHNLAKK